MVTFGQLLNPLLMTLLRFLLLPALLLLLVSSCKQETPSGIDLTAELPLDSTVRTGTLENGLTYFIKKNTKPENRAELRLAVNVGSLQEDDDQQGLAHFMEHMLFNGTKNFEKNELVDYFELTGQRFGAHVNAYTSFDETVYMLKPRTDSMPVFDMAFQILEDWAHLATMEEEEIDKERGVVIEEWRSRLGPENRMLYQYIPVLYKDARYARRLPIGTLDVLENFDYETLRRFYREWYRPELMAVIAVGDFDVDYVEQKIKEHFNHIENPADARKREMYPVPDHNTAEVSIVTDPEASFTNVRIYHKHDKRSQKTVGDYKTYLTRRLLANMLEQRYDELKQQEDPPFVYAYSYYGNMARTKDAYVNFAMVNEANILRGVETILTENRRMLSHGFSVGELERAKESMLTDFENRFNERDKIDSRPLSMELVRHYLEGEPVPGIAYEYDLAQVLVPSITLDEVNALPGQWIRDENVAIIITAPEKDGVAVPTEAEVRALYANVKGSDVAPYEDTFTGAELLSQKPKQGGFVSEEVISEIGVTQLEFDNGARVLLKPTDFKNDQIMVSSYSFGGTSLYSDEEYTSAQFISAVVMMSGVGDLSQPDLQKALSGKNVQFMPYVDDITSGTQGETAPKDLETFLQLQYLYFTRPRQDPVSFKSFQTSQKTVYQNLDANPNFFFAKQLMRVLYNDHKRSRFPEAEDFDNADMEVMFRIYREQFANAGTFTWVVVGNFEVEQIKPLLATYIGGLPGKPGKGEFKDTGVRYPNKAISREIKKGTEPKSQVNLAYTGDFEWSYENRFRIQALADVLRIKLRETMREDKGGVYGVGVSPQPARYPVEDYMFSISFGCNPENVNDLIKAALAEVAKLKSDGATETDMKKIKETMLRERETNLKENRYWISSLRQYYMYEEDPKRILEYEQHVAKLTSADIKAAANQYLNDSRLIRFVMNPEKQVN